MISAAERLLIALVGSNGEGGETRVGVSNGEARVRNGGGGNLLPGVGVDGGKVAGDARTRIPGNTCRLKVMSS